LASDDARLRILWLAREMPVPLNAGDRIYSARLAGALAAAGAEVHFVGLAGPQQADGDTAELDPQVRWEVIPGGPRNTLHAIAMNRPLVGARTGTTAYARRLQQLLAQNRYDAVIMDQYGLSWALPYVQSLSDSSRPLLVHVAHDFETDVLGDMARTYRGNPVRKAALTLNARRTAVAERAFASACDLIVTLTDRDAQEFARIGRCNEFLVSPPGYDGPRRPTRAIAAASPRRVGLVGSYRWSAKQMNLAAFLEAGDDILAEGGIELAIAGDMPDDFRVRWEPRLKAARFMGFVDDLGIFLDGCRMGLVVEAVGGGFKLKVLDYAFTRTPIAALEPALGGQAPELKTHALVCADATALAHAVVATIDDIDRLNDMQEGAYRATAQRYDWLANGQRLKLAIDAGIARGSDLSVRLRAD
jgi:glycosyltransferase involved in cell wall biosynthesis